MEGGFKYNPDLKPGMKGLPDSSRKGYLRSGVVSREVESCSRRSNPILGKVLLEVLEKPGIQLIMSHLRIKAEPNTKYLDGLFNSVQDIGSIIYLMLPGVNLQLKFSGF